MNALEGLRFGLEVALQPVNLLAAFMGAIAGSIVGLLPGLGALAGAAILLPITYSMSPTAGLIMLAGMYYGVMYGGSTSAVLLNIPGEAPSVVAAFDGYEMAKAGRAGTALGIIALGSFIAGTTSVLLVAGFSPVLARASLMFGSAEFFALSAGGLLMVSRILGGRWTSSILPMWIGVALATIGEDNLSGLHRYTFGQLELVRGVDLVSVAIGVFGLTQLVIMFESVHASQKVQDLRFRELLPNRTDLRRAAPAWGRGGILGFGLGLLPGPSAVMATFLSYRVERTVSRYRNEIGKGAVEGVAGPEAANNAAATASMIPLLALGIPFSGLLALMLGALIAQGITPGPLIMEQHPEIFWGVIASMLIGNVVLLIINMPLIRVWVALLSIPATALIPCVLVIAIFGAFAARGRITDVYWALGLGVLGYVFRRYGFQPAPLLVGLVLGPLIEKHFREAMVFGQGDPLYFVQRPISLAIWLTTAIVLFGGPTWRLAKVVRRGVREA